MYIQQVGHDVVAKFISGGPNHILFIYFFKSLHDFSTSAMYKYFSSIHLSFFVHELKNGGKKMETH